MFGFRRVWAMLVLYMYLSMCNVCDPPTACTPGWGPTEWEAALGPKVQVQRPRPPSSSSSTPGEAEGEVKDEVDGEGEAEAEWVPALLARWLPWGYDLYVIGVQESACFREMRRSVHEYLGGWVGGDVCVCMCVGGGFGLKGGVSTPLLCTHTSLLKHPPHYRGPRGVRKLRARDRGRAGAARPHRRDHLRPRAPRAGGGVPGAAWRRQPRGHGREPRPHGPRRQQGWVGRSGCLMYPFACTLAWRHPPFLTLPFLPPTHTHNRDGGPLGALLRRLPRAHHGALRLRLQGPQPRR